MKQYDLILIETAHYKLPHYEKIQRQIAELLTMGGMHVAVINYKRDNTYHNNRIYDVLDVFPNLPDPPIISNQREGNNKIARLISKMTLARIEKKYFESILEQIKHLSNAIYWGTISSSTLNLLKIKMLQGKKVFLWEGAYYNFLFYNFLKNNNLLNIIENLLLSIYIKKYKINILVANEPIYDVLIKKKYHKDHLIIRPEESFDERNQIRHNKNAEFSLLTIGAMRYEKNLHFILDSLRDKKFKYILAGKSNNKYAYDIDAKMEKMDPNYFTRINKWFTDDEYHEIISKNHFLIICDVEFMYPGSNGTLFDAIRNMTPVIVPNHTHFKYYIEKYKIGLSYETNNADSFLNAIEKAKKLGYSYFTDNIIKMQKDFINKKIIKKFTNEIKLRIKYNYIE